MPTYTFVCTVAVLADGATPAVLNIPVNASSAAEMVAQINAAIDALIAPIAPQLQQLNAIKSAFNA